MMNVRPAVFAFGFLLSSLCATVSQASPITVSCPDSSATNDREFSFTFDNAAGGGVTCLGFGDGNSYGPFPGYTFIEKDNAANGGGTAGWMTTDADFGVDTTGTINFNSHIANQNLLLVLKSGSGQYDPDWVVFALTPSILSGTFNIVTPGQGQQSIAYMELYGTRGPIPAPEPASLLLLGTGLLGVARAARKRLQASRPEQAE